MKILVWAQTNKIGSRCETTIEVDKDDLEGISDAEVDELLDEIARDALPSLMTWSWERKEA